MSVIVKKREPINELFPLRILKSEMITAFCLCLVNVVLDAPSMMQNGFITSPAATLMHVPQTLFALNAFAAAALFIIGFMLWKNRILSGVGFSFRVALYTSALASMIHFLLLLPAFEKGVIINNVQYNYVKYLSLFQDAPHLIHELFYIAALAAGVPLFFIKDAKPLFRFLLPILRKFPKSAVFFCSVLLFFLGEITALICGYFSGQIVLLPIPYGRMTTPIFTSENPAQYRIQAIILVGVQILLLTLFAFVFCAVVFRIWGSWRRDRFLKQTKAVPIVAFVLWLAETAVICVCLAPGTVEAVYDLFLLYTFFPAVNAFVLFVTYLIVKRRYARNRNMKQGVCFPVGKKTQIV